MAGVEPEAPQGFGFGRAPILMGFVSLMLMLVAFFMVLVAMSEFDDRRVRSILASIQSSFAGMPGATGGGDEQSAADAIALEALRDEVATVFAAALQIDRIERTGSGAVEIDVAGDRLFAAGTDQLLPGARAVLDRVVAALGRRPAGYRYEVDVLVGRPSDAGDSRTAERIARSGALVRGFIAAGALPTGMAAGLQTAAPERVRFVVRLVAGARPAKLFGPAVEPAVLP